MAAYFAVCSYAGLCMFIDFHDGKILRRIWENHQAYERDYICEIIGWLFVTYGYGERSHRSRCEDSYSFNLPSNARFISSLRSFRLTDCPQPFTASALTCSISIISRTDRLAIMK